MNATAENSALPAAARARMERLQAEAANTDAAPAASVGEVVTPPTANTPALPTTDTVSSERVTMGREEYNELKASAAKASKAELELMELDELRHRLTQLEAQGKASSELPAAPAAPAAPAIEKISLEGVRQEITPEDQENFGESQAYVEKIAANKVIDLLEPLLEKLNLKIHGLAERTEGLGNQFNQDKETAFRAELKKNVPNLQEIISHKHWGDFLDETEALSGATHEQLLAAAVSKRNLRQLMNIYKAFQSKYMGSVEIPEASGYNGASPSGVSVAPSLSEGQGKQKLKLSARKQASEDFRKGRITWEKLQEVDKAFKEAEAQGLVDNNS